MIRSLHFLVESSIFFPYKILESNDSKLVVEEQTIRWGDILRGSFLVVLVALFFRTKWFALAIVVYFVVLSLLVVLTKRVAHTYIVQPGKLTILRRKLFGGSKETCYSIPELLAIRPAPFQAPTVLPLYMPSIQLVLQNNIRKTILSAGIKNNKNAKIKSQAMAEAFANVLHIQVQQ